MVSLTLIFLLFQKRKKIVLQSNPPIWQLKEKKSNKISFILLSKHLQKIEGKEKLDINIKYF